MSFVKKVAQILTMASIVVIGKLNKGRELKGSSQAFSRSASEAPTGHFFPIPPLHS